VTSLYHFVINIKTTCGTDFRCIDQSKNKKLKYAIPQEKKKTSLFIQSIVTNEIQNKSAYLHGLEVQVREFIRVGRADIRLFIRRRVPHQTLRIFFQLIPS
jgi:polyferredoxin